MTDQAVEEALNAPVEQLAIASSSRPSSPEPKSGSHLNGKKHSHTAAANEDVVSWPADDDAGSNVKVDGHGSSRVRELEQELARTREERDGLEGQYKGLLGKLTQMRSTLGDRLRQDAEELDRREQQIESLSSRTDDLNSTIETLKGELLSSNAESERVARELDALRALSAQNASDGVATLEGRARELQETVERLRIESEGWESACMEERATREDLEAKVVQLEGVREQAERERDEHREVAERERDSSRGLQQVLEEFQASQDSELQRALGDYQEKYDKVAASLEEYKERALAAETQLSNFQGAAERSQTLEREVKEKNLLIGKLRHEAVILNEHLTEALRRLRKDTSDSNVDRRLVTNLLLQFLTTPRADAKRFEMLSLIASVLQWSDDERETAGLQRNGSGATGRKVGIGAESAGRKSLQDSRSGHGRARAIDGGARDESFSNLFVEYLLSEASQAQGAQGSSPTTPLKSSGTGPSTPTASQPTTATPSRSTFNLGSLAGLRRGSSDRSVVMAEGAGAGMRSPPTSPTPSSNLQKGAQ